MDYDPTNSPLNQNLKQWAHFPDALENSFQELKQGNGKFFLSSTASIALDDTDTKRELFEKIIMEMEKIGQIDNKNIIKLLKINYKNDLGKETLIKECAAKVWGKNVAIQGFCDSLCKSYKAETFAKEVSDFIRINLDNNPEKIQVFAKTLALTSPLLLYLALPYLGTFQTEDRRLLAKLVISNPISHGLTLHQLEEISVSIKIEDWISWFRVKEEAKNNIREILGYLAEQLYHIREFRPIDRTDSMAQDFRFLHFMNGVMKYGIICKAKAAQLGISPVNSSDIISRPLNEVEVNCIQETEGIQTAIYHKAKGALTVAVERQNDLLVKKVKMLPPKDLPSDIPPELLYFLQQQKIPTLDDADALKEIEERAHHCIFLMGLQEKMILKNNEGQLLESNSEILKTFQHNCELSSYGDKCAEVPIRSNIVIESFFYVAISDRFELYKDYIFQPSGIKLIFVSAISKEIKYAFHPEEGGGVLTTNLSLTVPDFESALTDIVSQHKGKKIITHVSKGKCGYDSW